MKTKQQSRVEHKLGNGQTLSQVELKRLLDDSRRLTTIEAEHKESLAALEAKNAALARTNRSLQDAVVERDRRIEELKDTLHSTQTILDEINTMAGNAAAAVVQVAGLKGE